ncbi:MAG: hypothetical protein ACTH0V_00095 [Microbacteriaceae bacterium]
MATRNFTILPNGNTVAGPIQGVILVHGELRVLAGAHDVPTGINVLSLDRHSELDPAHVEARDAVQRSGLVHRGDALAAQLPPLGAVTAALHSVIATTTVVSSLERPRAIAYLLGSELANHGLHPTMHDADGELAIRIDGGVLLVDTGADGDVVRITVMSVARAQPEPGDG